MFMIYYNFYGLRKVFFMFFEIRRCSTVEMIINQRINIINVFDQIFTIQEQLTIVNCLNKLFNNYQFEWTRSHMEELNVTFSLSTYVIIIHNRTTRIRNRTFRHNVMCIHHKKLLEINHVLTNYTRNNKKNLHTILT